MRTFGLIGYPLTHSFSSKYFESKFKTLNITDSVYQNFELQNISDLAQLIGNTPNLIGLNVTIPYKKAILPFLDEVNEQALAVGAVNTIKVVDGKLIGFNTDIIGFEKSLKPLLHNEIKYALILGSGGAASAVEFVLNKLGLTTKIASRNPSKNQIAYSSLESKVISENLLIINCTPLGMYPNENECVEFDYSALTAKHVLFDLIYNPIETLFLKKAKAFGAQTKNGLEMLQIQADSAWEIWNLK